MALKDGEAVAAIAPLAPGAGRPWGHRRSGTPTSAVDDVDSASEGRRPRVARWPHGALRRHGRRADVGCDQPGGATVCLWQAKQHVGAGLVNEPGS